MSITSLRRDQPAAAEGGGVAEQDGGVGCATSGADTARTGSTSTESGELALTNAYLARCHLSTYLGEGLHVMHERKPSNVAESRASLAKFFADLIGGYHVLAGSTHFNLATPFNRKIYAAFVRQWLEGFLLCSNGVRSFPVTTIVAALEPVFQGFPLAVVHAAARLSVHMELSGTGASDRDIAEASAATRDSREVNISAFLDALVAYLRFPTFLRACGVLHTQLLSTLDTVQQSVATDEISLRDEGEASGQPDKQGCVQESEPMGTSSASVSTCEAASMTSASTVDLKSESVENHGAAVENRVESPERSRLVDENETTPNAERGGGSASSQTAAPAPTNHDSPGPLQRPRRSQLTRIPCSRWLEAMENQIYSGGACRCELVAGEVIPDKPPLPRLETLFAGFSSGECNVPELFSAVAAWLRQPGCDPAVWADHECAVASGADVRVHSGIGPSPDQSRVDYA